MQPSGFPEDGRTTLVEEIGEPELRARQAATDYRCWLTMLAGPSTGAVFKLEGDAIVIGRGTNVDAYVDHPGLSRAHARVFRYEDEVYVEDLGSANGTFVRGQRLSAPVRLNDGDRIQLGSSIVLKFARQDALEEETAVHLYDTSVRDPLTRTYNRQYFEDRFESEIAFAKRHGTNLNVLMVDVDHFKRLNDTHGHPAGDGVLRVVGAALNRIVRREDVVARYGGEEFVLATRGLSPENAEVLAERVRRTLESLRLPWGEITLSITVSVGVATLSTDRPFVNGSDLIATADAALYTAKRNGRNRVVVG